MEKVHRRRAENLLGQIVSVIGSVVDNTVQYSTVCLVSTYLFIHLYIFTMTVQMIRDLESTLSTLSPLYQSISATACTALYRNIYYIEYKYLEDCARRAAGRRGEGTCHSTI